MKEQVDLTLNIVDTGVMDELDKHETFIATSKQLLLARVGNFLQNISEDFWSGLEMVCRLLLCGFDNSQEAWIKQSSDAIIVGLLSLRQRLAISEEKCLYVEMRPLFTITGLRICLSHSPLYPMCRVRKRELFVDTYKDQRKGS